MDDLDTSETVAALLRTLTIEDSGELEPTRTRQRRSLPPAEHASALLDRLRQSQAGRGALEPGDVLGMGGMGIVRAAQQTSIDRTVAVKRVRAEMRTERHATRLLQEGWITGTLEHPNIVPVHDMGVDASGEPYIVLKRVQGDPWIDLIADPDLLRDKHRPHDLVEWHLGVLLDVCQAVAFAHARGILHRDLKPENVMVGAYGEVLVMDWGLAVGLPGADPRLPRPGDDGLVATPAYMAPEMLPHVSSLPLDVTTDVYLLGACLFEVLTGRPPRESRSKAALIREVLAGPPALPDHVPTELARVCLRAMAHEPRDRFATVAEFAQALRDVLRHRQSAHLAAEAEREGAALLDQLTRGDADPQAVHARFGAVRFGYEQALHGWAQNPDARDGLSRIATALARWELDRGDAAAADRVLATVPEPDPALARRIADALRSAREKAEAMAEWQHEHDPSVGRGGRRLAMLLVGGTVSVLPLTYTTIEQVTTDGPHWVLPWVASLGLLAFIAPIVLTLKAALGSFTAATRPVTAGLVLVGIGQVMLVAGCTNLGVEPRITAALFFVLWAAIAAMIAELADRRLWLGAGSYVLAFLASGIFPDWIYIFMAAGNACMTAAGLWAFGGFVRRAGPSPSHDG